MPRCLYLQFDLDPRFEAGIQIKAAQDFDTRILALRRELGLLRLELLQRKAHHARELTAKNTAPISRACRLEIRRAVSGRGEDLQPTHSI